MASTVGGRLDPMLVLPQEILNIIFRLALEKTYEIQYVLLVSKAWSKYVRSRCEFWTSICHRSDRYIALRKIMRYCRNARSSPISLVIDGPIAGDEKSRLSRWLPRITSLKSLVVTNRASIVFNIHTVGVSLFHQLQELRVGTDSIPLSFRWCVENLPNLKTLELLQTYNGLDSFPTSTGASIALLWELRLIGDPSSVSYPLYFTKMIASSRQLKYLSLLATHSDMTELFTVLSMDCLEEFEFMPKSGRAPTHATMTSPILSPLESLIVSFVRFNTYRLPQPALPLRKLVLKGCCIHEMSIAELVEHYQCEQTLETLILDGVEMPPIEPWGRRECPRLRTIKILGKYNALDSCVLEWIEYFVPNLKEIDLGDSFVDIIKLTRLIQCKVEWISCSTNQSVCEEVMEKYGKVRFINMIIKN